MSVQETQLTLVVGITQGSVVPMIPIKMKSFLVNCDLLWTILSAIISKKIAPLPVVRTEITKLEVCGSLERTFVACRT